MDVDVDVDVDVRVACCVVRANARARVRARARARACVPACVYYAVYVGTQIFSPLYNNHGLFCILAVLCILNSCINSLVEYFTVTYYSYVSIYCSGLYCDLLVVFELN